MSPGNQYNPSYNRNNGTNGSAHFVQAQAPNVQYVPQVQYVQMPAQQQQQLMPPFPTAQLPAQTQQPPQQQSLFTSGYVDWSSLPYDTSECSQDADNKVYDVNWGEPDNGRKNFALMAFEGYSSNSALTQVSQQSLLKLCTKSCKESFALIRETNVHLQGKSNDMERKYTQMKCDLERKIVLKNKEISKLNDKSIETEAQIKTMIDSLGNVRQELADTKVDCEKWVESCKGYQMLLNKQTAANVKFGIGYTHTESPTDFTHKTDNDGMKLIQTSDMEECTSYHQNFLKKESTAEVKTTDNKPSAVSTTSGVETLKTADDLFQNSDFVSKLPSSSHDLSKKKEKAKACEICGLFNHITELCRYRKVNQLNKQRQQLIVGKQIKQDYQNTFFPNKQQSNKTLSKKKPLSQQRSSSQSSISEVSPNSSADSQTAEVKDLINLVKLLMTKVDGGHQKEPTIVLNDKSIAKKTWITKNGPQQAAPVLKSKPKAKLAWVAKTN
jgi:hypothetical protein